MSAGRVCGAGAALTDADPAEGPAGLSSPAGRVMLMTPVDLASNGVGAIFLNEILDSRPAGEVVVRWEPPFLMERGLLRGAGRFGRLVRAASSRAPYFHSLRLRHFRRSALDARVSALGAAADAAGARAVWVTASSPEVILIADRLAAMGRDLRVMVWDDPSYFLANLGVDPSFKADVMQAFGRLLTNAGAVAVIGRNMQSLYAETYGISSTIIRHGIDPKNIGPRPPAPRNDLFRLIFAGSLYSKKEWNALVSALERVNFNVGGRRVELNFMGRFPVTGARRSPGVNYLGERTFQQAMSIMSDMDAGYLPYWFDPRHELVARTSFPSKLSAYAAAGLAVFHHAPAYTEVTTLLRELPFGVSCPSLEEGVVIDHLNTLMELQATDICNQAISVLLNKEISIETMLHNFDDFVDKNKKLEAANFM